MRYVLFLVCSILANLCLGQLNWQPYYFDCGAEGSELSEGALRLTPATIYDSEPGFGWTNNTGEAFANEQFGRSRDAFSIDGISAKELSFRSDVPAGEWWVTLYMDAGYEDSSTVQLKINDATIDMRFHPFQPSAEPYSEIQTSYRVYQGLIAVEDALYLSIEGGDYDARLLAFSLIPRSDAIDEEQKAMLSTLQALGKYPGSGSLEEIRKAFDTKNEEDPDDPFYAYWAQQLDLLGRAETHFERRGWEKYVPITGLSIWGQLHQAVMVLDGLLNDPQAESSPLYERALFLRGRILYWLGLERGGPHEIARGRNDLARLYELYPEDQLLAMYNGVKVDLPDSCDDLIEDDNAPIWSNKQRELLCRMRSIAHWWVLEQQEENGEFGGKIGDDVELLRWWMPVLLSGDSLSFVGWSKLADGVFNHRKVRKGYSKKPLDVEHASEFIADTAPMMVVCSDESEYLHRLRYSVDYFMNLWTGRSDNGYRFFRSAWFSSREVDERPPRNRDHGYNSRAVKAVRYYAWKTGDPEVINALNEWSDAWLSAATRTDKGKPEGIIPASVRFPDEAFNGDEQSWYTANMFWKYFEWQATPGGMILDQLLYSYTLTRDEKYLEPLLKSLELINEYDERVVDPAIGSEAWAAKILREKGSFWSAAAQWRFLTGERKFDELLKKYGTPYLRYRLTGDEEFLEQGLEKTLENARYNTPLKTYEAIHTDRVYIKGNEHLTTMLTGNGSKEGLSPNFAVTWEDTPMGFTALVKENNFEKIQLAIYSHEAISTTATVRLWQLLPGDYTMIINGDEGQQAPLKVTSKGQRVTLNLPARQLITVEIR